MHVQSLDGAWELKQNGTPDVIKASVPGCVHLDLMDAGKIDDPFHGDNEFRVSWVHEADWTYQRSFIPDPELFEADRVYLECDGLDTIADVSLDGRLLGRADNMYVRHEFDLTHKLRDREAKLSVRFRSPVKFARPHMKRDPLHCPGDSIPGSVYTRKSPCQWGWDWGPKIPTAGIWRPIRLAAYSVARIEDLWVRQEHRNGSVTLKVEVAIERFRRAGYCELVLDLTHPDGQVQSVTVPVSGKRVRRGIPVSNPQLWWPNGYGNQPLYSLKATLTCDGAELHSQTRRVGLRTLKLEQKKDRWGRSFTFVVNGVRIFCKGADWIPADQFPPRITDDHYLHLVSSAAKANMNMLRIWGGGYYEDERFYDLCDEYGILIWQDFMFSCAQYPVAEWYLANVRGEVEFTIRRLRGRACLALWCGNNEMEWFLSGGYGGERNAQYRDDYSKIFHQLIPETVARLDPDVSYWPSSPYSGEPFADPNAQDRGDGHYWDVWHGRQPFTAYRKQFHRFMSEFGFESLPDIRTCRSFAPEEELNITSHTMECHQKNGAGNGLILYYLAHTFRFPKDFEMMCYVSQLLQAEAMRYGIEHWRRNRGRCMGTLYWQFNDCWPVASWASIDYFGRWKALQYFAKRFYSPVLLSINEDGARAAIHVTNDTTSPVEAEVRWSLERLDGTVVRQDAIRLEVPGELDVLAAKLDFSRDLIGDALRRTVLVHELVVDGRRVSLGLTPFVPSKHLELPEAAISLDVKQDERGPYLEVSSDKAARFVCLSVPDKDVIFSDNCFDLPAGRMVTVRPESPVDLASLAMVRAYSLRDSY